jgi:hypothetical protein
VCVNLFCEFWLFEIGNFVSQLCDWNCYSLQFLMKVSASNLCVEILALLLMKFGPLDFVCVLPCSVNFLALLFIVLGFWFRVCCKVQKNCLDWDGMETNSFILVLEKRTLLSIV